MVIQSLVDAKYLGLIIRQDLKCKSKLYNVCTKANKTPGYPSQKLYISSTSFKNCQNREHVLQKEGHFILRTQQIPPRHFFSNS